MKHIGIIWLATVVLSAAYLIAGNGQMAAVILCAYWLLRLYDTFRRSPLKITKKQKEKQR